LTRFPPNNMKVLAQTLENPILEESLKGLSGVDFIKRALPFLINWLILAGFGAFLIYFFIGAYNWITSKGDKTGIEEAKKQLTNSFIGLFIIFSIFVIIKVIGWVFGIKSLEELIISLPRL